MHLVKIQEGKESFIANMVSEKAEHKMLVIDYSSIISKESGKVDTNIALQSIKFYFSILPTAENMLQANIILLGMQELFNPNEVTRYGITIKVHTFVPKKGVALNNLSALYAEANANSDTVTDGEGNCYNVGQEICLEICMLSTSPDEHEKKRIISFCKKLLLKFFDALQKGTVVFSGYAAMLYKFFDGVREIELKQGWPSPIFIDVKLPPCMDFTEFAMTEIDLANTDIAIARSNMLVNQFMINGSAHIKRLLNELSGKINSALREIEQNSINTDPFVFDFLNGLQELYVLLREVAVLNSSTNVVSYFQQAKDISWIKKKLFCEKFKQLFCKKFVRQDIGSGVDSINVSESQCITENFDAIFRALQINITDPLLLANVSQNIAQEPDENTFLAEAQIIRSLFAAATYDKGIYDLIFNYYQEEYARNTQGCDPKIKELITMMVILYSECCSRLRGDIDLYFFIKHGIYKLKIKELKPTAHSLPAIEGYRANGRKMSASNGDMATEYDNDQEVAAVTEEYNSSRSSLDLQFEKLISNYFQQLSFDKNDRTETCRSNALQVELLYRDSFSLTGRKLYTEILSVSTNGSDKGFDDDLLQQLVKDLKRCLDENDLFQEAIKELRKYVEATPGYIKGMFTSRHPVLDIKEILSKVDSSSIVNLNELYVALLEIKAKKVSEFVTKIIMNIKQFFDKVEEESQISNQP